MRVYLDCCCLQRPFDDQTQSRILIEAEAVALIVAAIRARKITLLNSDALEFEAGRTRDVERREDVRELLHLATEHLQTTPDIREVANDIAKHGILGIDALHLAIASAHGADFFATCDDILLRKAQRVDGLRCKVVSLLTLCDEVLP